MSVTTSSTPPTDSFGLTPSVYGAEAAMLSLADSFLQPGAYSTLRAGFFGYMTGAMSRIAAEGAYHRNVLYKEQFLNTCSLPDSIYNFAKIYEITPALGTPSNARILLGFYLTDLQGAIGSATGTFTIPRGQPVLFGSTPFVVAGEIDIALDGTDSNGNVIVTASYNLDEMDFPAPAGVTLGAPIRTYVLDQATGANGAVRQAVYAEVYLVQAQASVSTFKVTSSSALQTLYYDVAAPAAPQQLAGFTVLYQGPTDAEAAEVPVFFNESVVPTTPTYAFYNYAAGEDLEIFFSPLAGSFQPAYNSTLTVNTFSTLGSGGNFDFSGTITCVLAAPFKSLAVLTELVTQPTGGADQQSLLALKQAVQSTVLTRKSIVTENDLEAYLAGAVAAASVNGSQVTFVKRRDDIEDRIFNAFLLMYDSAGRIVPTNSVDLSLEIADLDAAGWSLKPGTIVVYDRANQIFRLLAAGEFPDQMVGDPNNFVYAIPYLMAFFVSPYPRLTYFNNMADVDQALTQAPGDFYTGDSFLGNSLTVQRNAALSDTYQLDFVLTSSLPSTTAVAAACIMRAVFVDPANPTSPLGYVEMDPVTGTSDFRALVATADGFDSSSNLILTNALSDMNTGAVIASCSIPQDLTVQLELYYYSGSTSTAGRTIQRSGQVFQLVYVWTTAGTISLYQSLEQVAGSEMYVDTAGVFHAGAVPLIGANYFLNPRLGQAALGVAAQYQDAVVEAFDLLANSTSVSLKFYNTYGPSVNYNVDRVNLTIDMGVGTGVGGSAAIEAAVVAAAAAFVAASNANANGRFSVSNMTTSLETGVAGVQYVQSVTINGVPTQTVQYVLTPAQLQQDNKRVPEFLNAGTVLTSNLAADPYSPDVNVTFVS
jgi:hypothetical protein